MKKFLAILMAICMMASMLCVTAFAAESDAIVMEISGLKKDGKTIVSLNYWTKFDEGWEKAVDFAEDDDFMEEQGLDRIIVDLKADWNANSKGEFGKSSWDGFRCSTIYVPSDTRITINLNGHAINRGLTRATADGEVIFINDDADVIINNGTIKGGYGDMGDAGAIYIDGNARVTLNNVNVVNNRARWNGAGISVGAGSILTVNGGSFQNNEAINAGDLWLNYGGAVYVDGSTAVFKNVEFKENIAPANEAYGAALYADNSNVVIDNCTFNRNGIQTAKETSSETVIHSDESSITITNSTFTDNVARDLFYMKDSILNITGGVITKTAGVNIFHLEDTQANIEGVTITDNASGVMTLENSDELVNMIGCILGNNTPTQTEAAFVIDEPNTLALLDCTLGDTTFSNKEYVKISTSEVSREEGLISIELFREDGTVDSVRYYKDIASGWDYAIECAKTNAFNHVIINLFADWNVKRGFMVGAAGIPENAKVTINMNGHTIDNNATDDIINGEVLYIGVGADVVINDGTITGGYSNNGAGGIHIKENATVVLNNVNVDKNATDGSKGAGIAVYDGANLTMNGGSISQNEIYGFFPYGILYVNEATATLNGVTISGNKGCDEAKGVAIYADESTVTLNNCVVSDNDTDSYSESIIGAVDSKLIINNTYFINNGAVSDTMDFDYSHLFYLDDCDLTMTGGEITETHADKIFYLDDSKADIKDFTITGNASIVLDVDNSSAKVTLTDCILGNNEPVKEVADVIVDVIVDTAGTLVFTNCELGDTTFENKSMVTFSDKAVGSIFGEGSLTTIVAILALIASGVSIFLTVYYNKKKSVPVTANNAEETEDEE